jgi:hypothetical protein
MTSATRTVACLFPGRRRGRGQPRTSPAAPAPPRTPLPAGRLPRVSPCEAFADCDDIVDGRETETASKRPRSRPQKGMTMKCQRDS